MDNFCFKSDVSTDFRSFTPFQGELAMNAGRLFFYGYNIKKKLDDESPNGSTRTIMVFSHFGGFNIQVLYFGYVFSIVLLSYIN